MIHIGSLKKDMIILEKSEFSALRNENEVICFFLKELYHAFKKAFINFIRN